MLLFNETKQHVCADFSWSMLYLCLQFYRLPLARVAFEGFEANNPRCTQNALTFVLFTLFGFECPSSHPVMVVGIKKLKKHAHTRTRMAPICASRTAAMLAGSTCELKRSLYMLKGGFYTSLTLWRATQFGRLGMTSGVVLHGNAVHVNSSRTLNKKG